MANKSYDIDEMKFIRNTWVDIPEEAVNEKVRSKFAKRKLAVNMYIDGYPVEDIEKTTGIVRTNLIRLLKKCMEKNATGEYFGYEALIPYTRMGKQHIVREDTFQGLLNKYPALKDYIKGNYFGDKKYTLEKNMNFKTLHKNFLEECKRLGIQINEYPFCTENKAYVSLVNYIKILKQDIDAQASRESKDNRQKLTSTGIGKRYTRNALVPFQTVQIDGHILDLHYAVEVENTDGTIGRRVATRAWLIAVIDVATRTILGFSVSQEENYNQYDIIDAIINAIKPREKMSFSVEGLAYPENGGYYSLAMQDLQYVLFDEIMLDNAKSHLSEYTMDRISRTLKCVLNYGSVATPETRGIIERFFGSLETRGFHRVPMTTGSNPRDLKQRSPETAALKYHVTYDEIVELLECLIAEYNTAPHSALDNRTPLEAMYAKIYESGLTPCLATEEMRKAVEDLRLRTETRIVRGATKNGKRPYISFKGVEYWSRELSSSGIYLGKKITIVYDPRDISTVNAYAENGQHIGRLYARGEFGTKSHSLKTRQNATKLARERGRAKNEFDTPITAYETHLRKSGKSRRNATRADILRREQHSPEPSKIKKAPADVVPIAEETHKPEYTYEDLKDLDMETVYKLMFGGAS